MKIIHITNCLRGGGIQNFLLSLLPEQVKFNHDVELIVIEKNTHEYSDYLAALLRKNGVNVFFLNKERSNKISLMRTLYLCRKRVFYKKPDIVNTHGEMSHIYGAFSTILSDIPHCITIHNAPEKWDRLNIWLNTNKPMIYCSDSAYDLRVQKSKQYVVINNGVSPAIIKNESVVDLRTELGLTKEDKIIVSVGSLRKQKNYDFLKSIVEVLNDEHIHFCICGGNYGQGYIETGSFKKYKNIHFLGLRSDITAIENGSDVFLSCAVFEGLPIAVLEAYFNGIPCVLSPIIQHKRISQDIYACYIPKDFTAESFVDSIKKAFSLMENHEDIYAKRKASIHRYTVEITAKNYIDFYRKICNEK